MADKIQEFSTDDLDALSRPSGETAITNLVTETPGGGSEEEDNDELDFGDVPVIEGKEKQEEKPANEESDLIDELNSEEEETTEEIGQGNDQPAVSVLSKLAAQLLQEHTGAAVTDIPKNLDSKGLLSLLAGRLAPKLHPAAAALQQTIDQGGTVEGFLENFTAYDQMLARSDEDLVNMDLSQKYGKNDKNLHGLSEDGIKARVAKMKESGDLELRAIEIRNYLSSEKIKHMEQMAAPAEPIKPVDVTTEDFKKGFDSDFNRYADKAFANKDLFGITHKNADKFVTAMKGLAHKATFPDKETRIGAFQAALKDGEQFVKMAALFELARTNKLALELNASKRNVSRELAAYLDKDARTGKAKSKQSQDGGLNADDLNALSRPSFAG